jgi:aspartyl-tRNA(Asn)/glutamyl-tRNA(Gln) amidotransferase subunit B
MRSKEYAHDYRYFPEPDLLPLVITEEWKAQVRQSLPELPQSREERFTKDLGLPQQDAVLLTSSLMLANYFEDVVRAGGAPQIAANWLLNEYPFLLQEAGVGFANYPVAAPDFAKLLSMVEGKTISGTMAKDVLREMITARKRPEQIVAEKGLQQISDVDQLAAVAREIIAANPKQVEQFRKGKTATLGWFVGQVMKATRGQANAQMVQEVLKKELG